MNKFLQFHFQFCQPQGWKICSKKLPPTFFISVLTDIGADRHYVACLSFYEPRFSSDNSSSLNDAEDDDEILNNSSIVGSSPDATIRSVVNSHSNLPVMYCPKCLVLVSRHEYFEVFRVKNVAFFVSYTLFSPSFNFLFVSELFGYNFHSVH